jgi:predicted Zn-dependent peptidase
MVLGDTMTEIPVRFTANIVGNYFGGGMGSVLFQEIREFRSMAYSTNAAFNKQIYQVRESVPTYLSAYVGTQGDKTVDAMTVLDSLIRNLPLSDKRFEMTVKDVWSDQVTGYPSFRGITSQLIFDKRSGLTFDTLPIYFDLMESITLKGIEDFWQQQVAGRPIVWAVVGDPDKIGMENLDKFGTVTQLKPGDVMK